MSELMTMTVIVSKWRKCQCQRCLENKVSGNRNELLPLCTIIWLMDDGWRWSVWIYRQWLCAVSHMWRMWPQKIVLKFSTKKEQTTVPSVWVWDQLESNHQHLFIFSTSSRITSTSTALCSLSVQCNFTAAAYEHTWNALPIYSPYSEDHKTSVQ